METEAYMELALEEAERGLREEEVPVGCVVVKEGRILLRRHNLTNALRDPLAHAELLCVRELLRRGGVRERVNTESVNTESVNTECVNTESVSKECVSKERANPSTECANPSIAEEEEYLTLTPPLEAQTLEFYITIEPCAMCAGVLERLGVSVVFGEFNEIFGNRKILGKNYGRGVGDRRGVEIFKRFYETPNKHNPSNGKV